MTTSRHGSPFARLARVVLLATTGAVQLARADVRLPSIISDHMVLQCHTKATIWGWANAGDRVVVTPSWSGAASQAATAAPGDGLWTLQLNTPAAGGPFSLQIKGPDNAITVNDVLLGEVWVCGGQSNMEFTVDNIDGGAPGMENAKTVRAQANDPQLRYFDVPNVLSVSPTEHCGGEWVVCSPSTVGRFSAVGYFFARSLRVKLNEPVGLIGSNWGGTRVETWMSEETLHSLGVCGDDLDFLATVRRDPSLPERQMKARIEQWWIHALATDPGSSANPAWSSDAFDDSSWNTAALPGPWDATPAGAFDGLVWYRRTFEVPTGSAASKATLQLGPIDDMDTVWINGQRVGGKEDAGNWFVPRNYEVAEGVLRDGVNSIAIRVLDTGGAGGLMGAEADVKLMIHQQGPAATATGPQVSLAGTWRMKRGASMQQLGAWPWNAELHANTASVLYNGMIVPIHRFAVRGAIWYQGESNRDNAWDYRRLFPTMIANWRRMWDAGAAEFPFYFVQIAPFRYGGDKGETAVVRESQLLTMETTPNTGMAVTMDVGNVSDIHPRNKKVVGDRLALWALTKTYGKDVGEYSGPLYESMQVVGSEIELFFTHSSELRWHSTEPIGFEIAGRDRKFWPAQARIAGEFVVVSSTMVAQPVAVRYGWGDAIEPSLFNSAGLPATPFRTDNWPVATQP